MLRKEQTEEFIKEFLFFFSLLKRKKRSKKRKAPRQPPILSGNVLHDWQCNPIIHNKNPLEGL